MVNRRLLGLAILGLGCCAYAGCRSSGGIATAQTGFSLASIKGNCGFSFSAAIPGATSVEFVGETGVYHADGAGHLSGTESYNFTTNGGGHSCINVGISGTYTVNPDGTGTDSINLSSSDPQCSESFQQALVIAQGDKVVKATNLQPGVVLIAGEWTRQ